MGFFVAFFVGLALQVLGELLRPKQKPTNAKPSSIDDFSIPTAEEGRSVPVFCGKVKIDGANVTWYGDLEVQAIKKKVKTGWFSSTQQTIGFKYFLGLQMFLAHARADLEVHEIRFGDKMPAHTRTNEANGVVRFDFNDENFYGGNEKEGGITGLLRLYRGNDLQTGNAYFASQIGESAPGYRRFCYAMLEKMYLGTSPYIKPVGFILSSYPNTLGVPSNHHKIGDDANPICFIFEIINDPVWGLNVNAGRFNLAGWLAAAETCYTEGYGISMIVNGGSSAEDLIDEVLRHIDGVVYTDPATGLLEIKLARKDYVAESLPTFGPDDMLQAPKFARASWSQTKNTIKVTYVDREANFTEAVVSQQDLANIQQREGEIASEDISFLGFSNFAAADLACARALKTLSYPLAKASLVITRKGWDLRPGSVIRINWPARGIANVIMRVVRIDYGNLNNRAISIEAVEDIFAISQSAYTQPPPSGWVDPVTNPLVLARSDLFELPYTFAGGPEVFVATLGSRASGIDEGYDIWSGFAAADGNLTFKSKVSDFTPSAVTTAIYDAATAARDLAGFAVGTVIHGNEIPATVSEDELLAGGNVALIRSAAGDELVAFKTFNGTQVGDVIRGQYGTQALTHPAGAVVWFLSAGFGVENDQSYNTGLPKPVYAKLLTYNVRGVLPLASATLKSITVDGKALKPYPPKYLRVNNSVAPGSIPAADAVLTWEFRNVEYQSSRISINGTGSDPLPPGGTYAVQVYNSGLRRTVTGLTAPTWTHTIAMQDVDGTGTPTELRVTYTSPTGITSNYASITYTATRPNTVILLHFDGVDGSTANQTCAPYGETCTLAGGAQLDTAQSVFGGASLLFNGVSAYAFVSDNDRMDFGSSNFTVEMWVRFAAVPTAIQTLYEKWQGEGHAISVNASGQLYAFMQNGTSGSKIVTDTVSVVANQWYHVALVRDGTNVRFFKDGVQVGVQTGFSGAIANNFDELAIGRDSTGVRYLNGWIEEFRASKVARYTANFTPPAVPFTVD